MSTTSLTAPLGQPFVVSCRPRRAIAHFPHNHRANLFQRYILCPPGVVRSGSQALSPHRVARLRQPCCLITGWDRQKNGSGACYTEAGRRRVSAAATATSGQYVDPACLLHVVSDFVFFSLRRTDSLSGFRALLQLRQRQVHHGHSVYLNNLTNNQ